MRRYRPLTAVLLAIVMSALVGGFFGRSALATDDKVPEHYRTFTAALNAIEANYVDKVEADRLVYGSSAACSARWIRTRAFSIRTNTRRCASGRKAATTASASRFRRSTATSPRCSCSKDRRRTRKASAAATCSRKSPVSPPKGWTDDRGAEQAARAEGHERRRRRPAPRLRAADSARRDARRGLHPDGARVLHDRRDDRLHPAARLRREHRPRPEARAARARLEGHAAPAARHPRETPAGRSTRRSRWRTSSCRAAR